MTNFILDSMGMYETFISFDHFHLKMNLERSLSSKWNIIKSCIDLMFTATDENELTSVFNQVLIMYKDSNNSVMILLKLMEKKTY